MWCSRIVVTNCVHEIVLYLHCLRLPVLRVSCMCCMFSIVRACLLVVVCCFFAFIGALACMCLGHSFVKCLCIGVVLLLFAFCG